MEYIDFHTHRKTSEGVITPRSFGIHPWDADKETAVDKEQLFAKYADKFKLAEVIGECGLDKLCKVSMTKQYDIFVWQLQIASQQRKPVVVHCVRAFNELMTLRKEYNSPTPWVVHGFTGSVQLAMQLYKLGIWVSYGSALTMPQRDKVRQSLRNNPHPFLLETDDSDCGIEAVYHAAAKTKEITIEVLSDTIKENYTALFSL